MTARRVPLAMASVAARLGVGPLSLFAEVAIRVVLVAAVVVAAGLMGWLDRLDGRLTDLRFEAGTRAPSQSLVMVDIDGKSLEAVGVWPWDRTIHARLVEQLEDLGARQIAFDIDFSARSNPASDKAFAKAIGAAEVPVFLAAFRQNKAADDAGIVLNRPIDLLAAEGWPALVNVPLDDGGRVRRFPARMTIGGERLDALPALIAGAPEGTGTIAIDYSIDLRALPHVSASDVLYGRVKPGLLAGKTALVGARALELHDFLLVPRWGVVAGADVVAMASETLIQGRNLTRLPALAFGLPLMALAIGLSLLPAWRALAALFALALLTEAAAVTAQVSEALVLATAMPLVAMAGLMALVLLRDYGLRRALLTVARRETVNTRRFLERVIDDGFDGIVLIDERDAVVRINGEAARLLGFGEACPLRVADLPAPLPEVVAAVRRPDGSRASANASVELRGRVVEYSVVAFPLEGGAFRQGINRMCVSVALRDVTERQRAADRLRHMALHDELTGLANRAGLAEATIRVGGALIYFDLDHFKAVNDSLGHKTGDQLLMEVARRAEARVGGAGTLARMGGDEFAVYCPDGLDVAGELAAALLNDFARPFAVGGHRVTVGASFGVAGADWDCRDLNVLMRRADLALNAAQKQGRRRIAHFEASMEARLVRRLMLESELASALERDELRVAYQPQFDLATGAVVSAEALMRWRHPTLGDVSPGVFIPIAEETGLIHQLTGWMMKRAALDAVAWARPIPVAVNVSVHDLKSGEVPAMAMAALEHSGLPASRFELEVTESAFVGADPVVSDAFDRLRARGIALALDDYGTGYASLGYLHRFPFTTLKIDKSFVDGVPGDADAMAILQSVVVLARGLGLKTVAEGVEHPEQRDALEALGCDIGQGFLFSAPVDNAVLARMLARERAAVG